jgi:hypothetical protein
MKLRADLTGTAEVRAMLAKLGRPMAAQALAATAEDARDYAKGEADRHTKTGAMAASTYLRRNGAGWEVGHDLQRAPHALFVHWGTKPHKILPKLGTKPQQVKSHTRVTASGKTVTVAAHTRVGKYFLRWGNGANWTFSRGVNHPGYKGDPWLVRAAAQAPIDFARHVAERVRQISKD